MGTPGQPGTAIIALATSLRARMRGLSRLVHQTSPSGLDGWFVNALVGLYQD